VFVLLLTLHSRSSLPAASLEPPIAHNPGVHYDIFPVTGTLLGLVTDLDQLNAFECAVGKKHSVVKIYQAFWHGGFWEDKADSILSRGATEFLSLDPDIDSSLTEGDLNSCQVLSGDYDRAVITFATQIKSWGQPLLVSTAGEMNGDWPRWAGAKNFGPNCTQTYTETDNLYGYYGCTDPVVECADGPERYRDMYRHIHDTFAITVGVTNVTWVWVVNHESYPPPTTILTNWNVITNYYPGENYVDVISVDGYNWGDDGPCGCPVDAGWKTFDQIFSATLASLSSTYYPTKPFMIGEFASVEGTEPMSKANWITDAYSRIKSNWPQIKAVIWFHLPGECSFPVESSPESIWAYRQAVGAPYFIGDPVWCSYLPLVYKSYPFCTNSGSGGTETIKIEPPRTVGEISIDLIKRRVFPDGNRYGFSLWEVEIYGPGTGNLAIGAAATASSSQDSPGCYACFPDKAIDGNMNTRWGSNWSEPQWLTITLPVPQVVDRVVLKWEDAYAKEYCVNVIE
jgi:beta-mannanase